MTVLLVSAAGGHLAELHLLSRRLQGVGIDRHWVTSDSNQSRTLLNGESVTYARRTGPRELRAVLANMPLAYRLMRTLDVDCVVSNGSGIALSFIPIARRMGIPCHYIECAARTVGPSVTGKVLERIPSVRLYSQYENWATERWRYVGSVLEDFVVADSGSASAITRVVVTIGTIYPFRRLVERLLAILPPNVEVVWQIGATPVGDLGIDAHYSLPPDELDRLISQADVVVAHSGIGSALAALRAGKRPVLIAREHRFQEHVDDHQRQLAGELEARGLAVAPDLESLAFEDLERAASLSVVRADDPLPLSLCTTARKRTAKS